MECNRREAILLALARTILPPQFDENATLIRIYAVLDAMPRESQADVDQAIGLFDHPLAGLLTIGSLRRFAHSSPALQQRRLRAFQRSSLTPLRTIFLALQRVVASAYYADPQIQRGVGYDGPRVTV